MQIIDNFLEEPYFKRLEKLLNMYEFPWFTRKDISEKGKFSGHIYYQSHTFYQDNKILSAFFDELQPLYEKLEVRSLLRIKANLFPAKENLTENGWHTDYDFDNKTALLYINTNDGYTKLHDGTKIDSIRNRVLIFDSSTLHLSTNCTNDWARLNINLNYF